jgi:hypothetical protein
VYNFCCCGIYSFPNLLDGYWRHPAQNLRIGATPLALDEGSLAPWLRTIDLLGRPVPPAHHGSVAKDLEHVVKGAAAVAPNCRGSAGGLSYSVIWNALERIRKSEVMKGCQRLIQLLTFVVEATLKGEAGHLKETTIGVFVFGRTPDYDPKVDTIVRSQAWRLRGKLKEYYASEGVHDPILIDIPIGRYIPTFSPRDHKATPTDDRT